MPHNFHKPIASAGSDTSILFYVRYKHFKSKYTPKLEDIVFCSCFFKTFLDEIYMPPKPLTMNHRAALAIIHR